MANVEVFRVGVRRGAELASFEPIPDFQNRVGGAALRSKTEHPADPIADNVVAARPRSAAAIAFDSNINLSMLVQRFRNPMRQLEHPVVLVHDIERVASYQTGR